MADRYDDGRRRQSSSDRNVAIPGPHFAILDADLAFEGSAAATMITQADGKGHSVDTSGGAEIVVWGLMLVSGQSPIGSGRIVAIVKFKGRWQVISASCPP